MTSTSDFDAIITQWVAEQRKKYDNPLDADFTDLCRAVEEAVRKEISRDRVDTSRRFSWSFDGALRWADEMLALKAQLEKANEEAANFATDALRLERERDEARAKYEAAFESYDGLAKASDGTRNAHAKEVSRLRAQLARRDEALREIVKAEGAWSNDHLTHAANCIESMQALARAALGETDQAEDGWTTEPPTTPGAYWMKNADWYIPQPIVVHVCTSIEDGCGGFMVLSHLSARGHGRGVPLRHLGDAKWYGPLQPPEDGA